MTSRLGWIAAGGGLGALLRYTLLVLFPQGSEGFPWTIFMENIVGSFFLGLLLGLMYRRKLDWPMISFLGTGLLGSFTTFSNFSMDMVQLYGKDQLVTAVAYMLLSTTFGLVSAWAGLTAGRKLR